jgi:predicted Zn-dependent protease
MLSKRGLALAALFAAALLSACQTNPISGRRQLMIVSEDQAQASSAKAYAQTVDEAKSKGKLDTDAARTQRVKQITDRLIAQAVVMYPKSKDWQWSVHVIDEPTVNAWCMPGGKMAIYTGIIQKLNMTDDEIAQVMGHEISHALLGHGRERMSRAMATQGGLVVGSILTGADLTKLGDVASMAILLPNSRESESEADRWGIEVAAKAGYHPQAAVDLWQKMAKLGGGQPPQWMSTHPSNDTRIKNLSALVPQMMPYYEAAKKKG